MKKTTLKLIMLLAFVFVISCTDDTTEINEAAIDQRLASPEAKTNLGTYKGVFTTLDSEFRGVVEIELSDISTSSLTKSSHKAIITLQDRSIVYATSNAEINIDEPINNILFNSNEISFNFSVNSDGTNPVITNVVLNNKQADIILAKHTTRLPVTTFSGTYYCNNCGGSDTRSFNVIITNDGIGNQTYTTQMEFYGTAYPGIGMQDNCINDGTLTFCDAISGDAGSNTGFSLDNGDVVWDAEMSYSNDLSSCSEIIGIWYYRKGLSGEKSGTFRSDAITNCMGTLTFEDFENANINYTTNIAEHTDGSKNYFLRTDGSDISSSVQFNETTGLGYFAAQDIDADGFSVPAQITFENLNVASLNTIYFSAEFAEDDDGGNQDWDNPDYVHVDYSFDGGMTWTTFFAIQNDGSTFNSAPFIDTNLDGTGDGQEITDTFEYFRTSFVNNGLTNPTSSPTVSIRIEMSLDSGDEDIAIDSILIRGL